MKQIRIGTRRSQLALWQANFIREQLQMRVPGTPVELVHFTTQGDRILDKPLPEIGGKGLFTLELENALQAGDIDLAVHSLKDLPTQIPEAFTIGAVPERGSPFDALVCRGEFRLNNLPENAVIGTSSLRRSAQLLHFRRDFQIQPIRGNVETRINKARHEGAYDAAVLAVAGLERLALTGVVSEVLSVDVMLPAPGQGALGVQCRADDDEMLSILKTIDHPESRACVTAERVFLQYLEAGCRLPVSAYAVLDGETLSMTGRVSDVHGEAPITVRGESAMQDNALLGRRLAEDALAHGADALLAAANEETSES